MVSFGRKSSVAEATPEAPEGLEQVVAAPEPVSAPITSSTALGAFPRVNLIPDQIAAEAKVRKAKLTLGLAAAASVAVVAGLFVMAAGQVSSAQEQLDTANAHSAALATEAAKYADVPKVRADLEAAQSQQVQALGGEVRWSSVLSNLGLTIPSGVALNSFQASVTGTAANASAPATAGAVVSVLGSPGIGTIQYAGEAADDAKLASFLESFSRVPGVIDPFATQATATSAAEGAPSSVTFAATATINAKALSHRYDAKGN
jgi:Tfp pilus assembly protein PilN